MDNQSGNLTVAGLGRPKPGSLAPDLVVSLVGGGRWSLAEQRPERYTLVSFYRGLHCPVCRSYLRELDGMLDAFHEAGVTSAIAVSGDDGERAEASVDRWGIERLQVGYGQSVESMREWGLYVSRAIKEGEPDLFGEPGLFLVDADGNLYAAVINTMPFARPRLDDVLSAVRWTNERHYPARGGA